MSSRPRFCVPALACGLFTLMAAVPASAGNGRFKNGVFDFCVSVRFDATSAELALIRTAFENGSQVLADATDGQHRFGRVVLVNDSSASQSAEYWVHPGEGRAYATQGNYGVRGQHVNLFFESDFKGINGPDGDAYTIAHEHAHHAYGVLDEYSGPSGPAECAPPGTPDPANLSFCLMDNYFVRGGNAVGMTYTLNEFCVAANHDPDVDTYQDDVNGASCWATLSTHPTRSAAAPGGVPAEPPPPGHTVTFEDGEGGLRVVLLIDRSGSMNLAQRMQFAKASAKLFVDFLEEGDSIAVVSFAEDASVQFPLTTVVGQATKDAAKAAIDTITAFGLTNIGGGLQAALGQITGQPLRSCNEIVVLLSDGEHNTGTPRPVVLPAMQAAGVTGLTVGLGTSLSTEGEAELRNVATATSGKYFRVMDSFELVGLFVAISAEAAGNGLLTERPLNIPTGGFQSVGSTLAPGAKSSSFVIGIKDALDVITYTLLDPNGNTITKASAASNPDVEFLETPHSRTFLVKNPLAGTWEQQVTGDNIQTGIFEALVFVGKDGINLNVSADKELLTFPETTTLRAELLFEGQRVIMAAIAGNVRRPDGSLVPIMLFDDGLAASGDTVPDDGIYSARFDAFNEDGSYVVKLQGDSTAGVSTTFGGESHFPNAPPNAIPAPTFTRLASLTLVIEDVGVAAYCTAKTNSCGTLPAIDHTGTPSATAPSGFVVLGRNAPGPRPNGFPQNAELLYSLTGADNRPFQGGSLCVADPVRRSFIHPNQGGTINNCDATATFDMNQFAQTGPGNPSPALKIPGTQVWVQFWGRDKPAGNIFLTDALTYVIGP